jgi:SAM-dependent methyltransferase
VNAIDEQPWSGGRKNELGQGVRWKGFEIDLPQCSKSGFPPFWSMLMNSKVTEGFFPATAMPDSAWWPALWPRPGKVLADLGVEPEMKVIDLCCGDGLFTVPLTRIARRVVAIDLDPEMLRIAQASVTAAWATNCTFVVGDAYNVAKLAPDPADFVLIANTFHGVPDKPRLARAVATALKTAGRFAIVNWHRRPREETAVLGQPRGPPTELRMTPADVAAVVEPAGFIPIRVIELPPYHYGAIFQKNSRARGNHVTGNLNPKRTP